MSPYPLRSVFNIHHWRSRRCVRDVSGTRTFLCTVRGVFVLFVRVRVFWPAYACLYSGTSKSSQTREATSSTKPRAARSRRNENATAFCDVHILKTTFRNNATGRARAERIFPPSAGDIGEIPSPARRCATEGRNNNGGKKNGKKIAKRSRSARRELFRTTFIIFYIGFIADPTFSLSLPLSPFTSLSTPPPAP